MRPKAVFFFLSLTHMTGTPTEPLRLTQQERTASMTLGAVFALRLLGIFLILPVFSVWAQTLDGGSNAFMVGLALGVSRTPNSFRRRERPIRTQTRDRDGSLNFHLWKSFGLYSR